MIEGGCHRELKSGDHLYLIDGSGYLFRAYHALPPLNRKSDGLPTNAVLGFSNMIWKLLQDTKSGDKPSHLAVIFDAGSVTFRNDMYADYKANRTEPPEDLTPQFPLVREATRAFGVPSIEKPGFEADDLIATYARQAREKGARVTVVSSDKDLMQLVRDGKVEMLDPMKNKRIGSAEVIERFGVPPEKVVDVQALIGDSIDNVPGVRGIGVKTAAELIREYGSLEELLTRTESFCTDELAKLQAEIDREAGAKVKISSAAQLGQIFFEKLGLPGGVTDAKGKFTADAEAIERLAAEGHPLARKVARARHLARMVSSYCGKLHESVEQARLSKRLVLLDADVPLDVGMDEFGVCDPDAKILLPFLHSMEFTALSKRAAATLGFEDSAIAAPAPAVAPAPATAPAGRESRDTAGAPGTVTEAAVLRARIDAANYAVIADWTQLARWIADATEQGLFALAVEGSSPDAQTAELVGLALALAPGKSAYIPLGHSDAPSGGLDLAARPEQLPERQVLAALKPLLEDAAALKIGHNAKYAARLLLERGIHFTPVDDVMLMSYAADLGLHGHGIEELSEIHLGHKPAALADLLGKGREKLTVARVAVADAARYLAERADIALRLHALLRPHLSAEKRVSVYETLERPLVPVIARMEQAGISIDPDFLARLSNEFAATMARLEEEIYRLARERLNLGSPKQLGEVLFDKLSLPGGRKTRTGAWSTDADVLEELAALGHALPAKILEWRQVAKLKSTYTDALPQHINPRTRRVHTCFMLASTTTGRIASTEPNLQNIPIRTEEGRRIRRAFVAPPGRCLVSADYSQIELRLLAHIADVPTLRQAFAEGIDIHAMTASEMFGVPVKDMPAEIRRRAKAINFGIIYGISAFGLSNQLGIARGEADSYIKKYFERFPGIRAYMDDTRNYVRAHGFVETIFGRRIHIRDVKAQGAPQRAFGERQAINAPIQGSAADVIRRAMARLPAALAASDLDAQLLLQVHDELVIETATEQAGLVCQVAREVMEKAPLPAVQLRVPLVVDARAGSNWDEAH